MTLVQYAWLQQHGWAATDSMIENGLIFGGVEIPENDEDERKEKIKRYYDINFDFDTNDLSPEKQELLNILRASNASLTPEILEYLNDD